MKLSTRLVVAVAIVSIIGSGWLLWRFRGSTPSAESLAESALSDAGSQP